MSDGTAAPSTELVHLLGHAAGIEIAPESEPVLASLLARYIEAIRAIPLKEMLEVDPGLEFDPSWEDAPDA